MAAWLLVCIALWGISSLILGLTPAAKAIARSMGREDGYECIVAGSVLGIAILAAATYVWPER
jgi:hypothetical protein